jgi:hypothetical protein
MAMATWRFGPVKSAKVSLAIRKQNKINNGDEEDKEDGKSKNIILPPVSNGFGFVCFETEDGANQAAEAGKINFPKSTSADGDVSYYEESQIVRYVIKERND